MGTPAEDGFYMPGEFAPHTGCWMAWPCREKAFSGRLPEAKHAYAQVARAIAAYEPVTMVANPLDASDAAMACGPQVKILTMHIDDSWTRDTGPTFLIDGRGRLAGVDWIFNGWGFVWEDCKNDRLLARGILDHLGVKRYEADFVLEGGAIHVDGQGLLMAVEPCLLDPQRNPNLSRADLEARLSAFLGVKNFIWLEYGLDNDETKGHVDNVACFARPGLVLVHSTEDPGDPDYQGLRENAARLRAAKDARGRGLEVVELPAPAPREGKDGRMTLSYVNFYLANGAVIMPAFGDAKDDEAARIIKGVFPDRRVVTVPAMDIVYGGGGIHCITQQQPSAH